jgi:hypothetical protein
MMTPTYSHKGWQAGQLTCYPSTAFRVATAATGRVLVAVVQARHSSNFQPG